LRIEKNPYEVLDVRPDASQKQIRTRYRRLVQKYHPDLHPGDTAAALLMVQINSAYDIIGKPETRRQYDEKLSASVSTAEAKEAQAEAPEPAAEQTNYEEAAAAETAAAEAWAAREAQARQEQSFVSATWAEVTDLQPQEYANGWVRAGHLAWLMVRVILAIFVALLRFLTKSGDEGDDFLKF